MGFVEAIFGFILVGVAVVVAGVVLLVKMLTGGRSRGDADETLDEARMIQELHRGFKRLEDRVESLETILMDSKPREDGHEPQK